MIIPAIFTPKINEITIVMLLNRLTLLKYIVEYNSVEIIIRTSKDVKIGRYPFLSVFPTPNIKPVIENVATLIQKTENKVKLPGDKISLFADSIIIE